MASCLLNEFRAVISLRKDDPTLEQTVRNTLQSLHLSEEKEMDMSLDASAFPPGVSPTPSSTATGETPGNYAGSVRRMMRLRWWIWSVLAFSYLIVMFHRIAPGVVADRLMADFAVGGAAVGVLTSIYFYMYAVMQIPTGVLADTLGARKTVAIGTSLAGLGSVVFGLAPGLELAYAGRFLVGIGVSVVFVATMKFQVSWFRAREYGTISGLLILVGNLGGVAATTPVALMTQSLGWRLSFVLIGVITSAVAAAVWWWVRDRPSDLGLPSPDEVESISWGGKLTVTAPVARRPFLAGARIVLGNRQTRAGFLAHFGLLGSYLTFVGLWAVPYLMHVYGLSRFEAANYLLVASLGILISAPLLGHLSDRVLKRRRPLIIAMGVLGCGVWLSLLLWNSGQPPLWSLYPLFALLGFSAGSVSLVLTAVKEANPPELAGLAIGTANGAFLCAAILQPAVGYLLDGYWGGAVVAGARVYPASGYQVALAIMAVFAFAGLLGSWLIKETHCRNAAEW